MKERVMFIVIQEVNVCIVCIHVVIRVTRNYEDWEISEHSVIYNSLACLLRKKQRKDDFYNLTVVKEDIYRMGEENVSE